MEKIDEIVGKLTLKEITLEQAKQQVLVLFDVSNSSDLDKVLMETNMVLLETMDLLASKNCC